MVLYIYTLQGGHGDLPPRVLLGRRPARTQVLYCTVLYCVVLYCTVLSAYRDFGHFYGSSYVAAPDGSRTPGLSRTRCLSLPIPSVVLCDQRYLWTKLNRNNAMLNTRVTRVTGTDCWWPRWTWTCVDKSRTSGASGWVYIIYYHHNVTSY